MAKLTGGQTGGGKYTQQGGDEETEQERLAREGKGTLEGGRHRKSHRGHKSHKGNSWLAHVKATMKLHPGKSFKQVLKIAKKTYKRSQYQSSSQSGGKRRNGKSQKNHQNGGSGVAEYATAV